MIIHMSETIESLILLKPIRKRARKARTSLQVQSRPSGENRRWSDAEIRLLYAGLGRFGTDFSLIANTIPCKTRAQIIAKFHKEERRNRSLVESALWNREALAASFLAKNCEGLESGNTDVSNHERSGVRRSRLSSFESSEVEAPKVSSFASDFL